MLLFCFPIVLYNSEMTVKLFDSLILNKGFGQKQDTLEVRFLHPSYFDVHTYLSRTIL